MSYIITDEHASKINHVLTYSICAIISTGDNEYPFKARCGISKRLNPSEEKDIEACKKENRDNARKVCIDQIKAKDAEVNQK